jgi:hypothetical protein
MKKKSRFEELANQDPPEWPQRKWDRYGLTEKQWADLTPEQREIHYERNRQCSHPYVFAPIEGYGDLLREPFSFDPYAHTPHMEKCLAYKNKCDCAMCLNKVGLARRAELEC